MDVTKQGVAIETLSFEIALKELEQIAQKLEKGDSPLAEAIDYYERGGALQVHCEKLLQEAELRFDKVRFSDDGKVSLSPVKSAVKSG